MLKLIVNLFISYHCIGATTVEAYFPKGSKWYDIYTDKVISTGGESLTLESPIDHIPVSCLW